MSAAEPFVERISLESQFAARRWRLGGRVQGVGFRPFVYRLAEVYKLAGWVFNNGGEVEIHAQGTAAALQAFGAALLTQAPPAAIPTLLQTRPSSLESHAEFRILPSTADLTSQVHVPLDLFTCDDCLSEMLDPEARRYEYPFINCTQCGPRYTLIRALPYDRCNTTLDRFALCADCAVEYSDPRDRRFHAEPLGCPVCGPVLAWKASPSVVHGNAASLAAALKALIDGAIVGLRGVGGYHLLCDARNEAAVTRLRARKARPAKPLAVMVPWHGRDGLDYARALAELAPLEAAALLDPMRPIVVATRLAGAPLAESVAPGIDNIGLMLPYSPLHHLLLRDFGAALVATSGNISGEPVLTDAKDVEGRLGSVADGFLHHDRPIARPADDPVIRVIANARRPIRLGRGSAPIELALPGFLRAPVLAVGAHRKATIALGWDDRAVVSPHIGDLSSPRGQQVFAQVIGDLQQLYGATAQHVVHDAHPGFPSTRWARESGLSTQAVWHHGAHASAVAGEYPSKKPLLCFTWDGAGLGTDGTLWGGEALLGHPGRWMRVASFRPFRLPGGERAMREPWRAALALCWECGHSWTTRQLRDPLLRAAWESGFNTPTTTSVGRLFDAASALLGVCDRSSYEGEAAMRLETLCSEAQAPIQLPLAQDAKGLWRSDWAPLLPTLQDPSCPPSVRAGVFHASLAHALCEQALAVRGMSGVERVGLSGGVFQNRVLTEHVHTLLAKAGFEVLMPTLLPVNDAAISFGQLVEAGSGHVEYS
jgi:hydrogenase maturation protein HypF